MRKKRRFKARQRGIVGKLDGPRLMPNVENYSASTRNIRQVTVITRRRPSANNPLLTLRASEGLSRDRETCAK